MRAQRTENGVIERVVILGHQRGKAQRHRLARREHVLVPGRECGHHRLREALRPRRCRPRLLSRRTGVQGGDREPHQLLELGVEKPLQPQGGVESPQRLEGLGEMAHSLENGGVLVVAHGLFRERTQRITAVGTGTGADQAGLRIGDTITAWDGQAGLRFAAQMALLRTKTSGDTLMITYDRRGQATTVPVVVRARGE